MGLDSFKSGNDTTSTDDTDNEEQEEPEQEEETTTEQSSTGLDSFRTTESSDTYTDDSEPDSDDNKIFGLYASEWNQMSKAERVEHVRDNYVDDYHPDFQADGRWEYQKVTEVKCVCGKVFTFYGTGMCLECGRAYEDVGRTVRKTHEIEDEQ